MFEIVSFLVKLNSEAVVWVVFTCLLQPHQCAIVIKQVNLCFLTYVFGT